MNRSVFFTGFLGGLVFLVYLLALPISLAEENQVPSWIKNNAQWWSDGQVNGSQTANLTFGDGHSEIKTMQSGDIYQWIDEHGNNQYLIYCANTLVNIKESQVEGGCQDLTQSDVQQGRVYFRSVQYPDFYEAP